MKEGKTTIKFSFIPSESLSVEPSTASITIEVIGNSCESGGYYNSIEEAKNAENTCEEKSGLISYLSASKVEENGFTSCYESKCMYKEDSVNCNANNNEYLEKETAEEEGKKQCIKQGLRYANYTYDNSTKCYSFVCDEEIITKHKVIFDSNGGTKVNTQQVQDKLTATEPESPTKSGYEFVEWRLNGIKYDFRNPVTSDIILTAHWIKLNQQGGNCTYTINLTIKDQFLTKINPKIKTNEFRTKFNINSYCNLVIANRYNEELKDTDNVGTGTTSNIYQRSTLIKKYTNIIKGDITGDGIVDTEDIDKAHDYYKGKIAIEEDYYLLAGDVNNDNKIDLSDVSKMYRYYTNKINNLD